MDHEEAIIQDRIERSLQYSLEALRHADLWLNQLVQARQDLANHRGKTQPIILEM